MIPLARNPYVGVRHNSTDESFSAPPPDQIDLLVPSKAVTINNFKVSVFRVSANEVVLFD